MPHFELPYLFKWKSISASLIKFLEEIPELLIVVKKSVIDSFIPFDIIYDIFK